MCLRERPRAAQQLAHTNSSESDGDVELLVGHDPVWRFVAHRSILAAESPVFEAMFQGPLATTDGTIEIQDVDPRAFDYFLKFLYGRECHLQNVSTTLNVLYTAHRYLLSSLVEHCVRYLDQALSVDTALTVYLHARRYSPIVTTTPPESPGESRKVVTPSAPLEERDRPPEPAGITGWSAVLLTQCLTFIDAHAEEILRQEAIEDAEPSVLQEILSRDSLACPETSVFNVVQRWSECECRRQHLVPTPSNRRSVLEEILYLVRFPRLTSDEFMRGPLQSDLLTCEETKLFSALIAGSPLPKIPPHVKRYLTQMRTGRAPIKLKYLPEDLKVAESSKRGKSWRKSFKSKPAKLHNSEKSEKKQSRCSGSCITDSIVDVIACIFD